MIKCLVCGYIIKEELFDKNKEAIPFKNSKDNVRYCPFCGATSEWIKDSSCLSLLEKKKLNEKTLKIIRNAMKLEVFNGDFYKEASDLCLNKSNKDFFKSLSNIEYTHAQIHRRLCEENKLPRLKVLNYNRFKNQDSMLLQEALKREDHAIKYYKKYIDELCDNEIKEIFKILSKVEQDHINLASIRNK